MANLLYLAESEYVKPALRDPRLPLTISAWTQYVLDEFATVAEAVDALRSEPFYVVPTMTPDGKPGSLHLAISSIELGSTVCTDGLNSYRELNGYIHNRKVQNLRQGGEHLLPRVHLVISLLKRWLLGTLQGSASDNISTITSMNSCFALIDVDLPHAENFSIVWLNRPSTPSQRHT